jgi:Domain of unknown function (DUF5655)
MEANALNKVVCPSCKRVLRNLNAYHYCKQINIDDIFVNKSDDIVLIFDKLLQSISDWPEVEISATKNCVVFVKNKTFLVLKPMSKCLELKFYSSKMIDDDLLHKCQEWNSKYEGNIRLYNDGEVTESILNYIKNSYDIS